MPGMKKTSKNVTFSNVIHVHYISKDDDRTSYWHHYAIRQYMINLMYFESLLKKIKKEN